MFAVHLSQQFRRHSLVNTLLVTEIFLLLAMALLPHHAGQQPAEEMIEVILLQHMFLIVNIPKGSAFV
jgi:hypothetical protein